jgi:hypothetical protein
LGPAVSAGKREATKRKILHSPLDRGGVGFYRVGDDFYTVGLPFYRIGGRPEAISSPFVTGGRPFVRQSASP